ncbi:matrixin family metalloprotease [Halomicronema sp. CCY15110]|uniref:matrixin family metalloprotease n=1 Tax=Halomicronema sp. CCY15110 TaxID=2767773 RepID=UPI001950171E|nr:matrixin family metalloprotease [Halomicronema sp. CCY15110]
MFDHQASLTEQLKKLLMRVSRLEAALDVDDLEEVVPETAIAKQFCSLPQIPNRELPDDLSPHRARLIRYIDKKWMNGTKLRYYFFTSGAYGGAIEQIEVVREAFRLWENVGIGLTFEEITNISEAEIRIGFERGVGSWSYVGRDVLDIPGQAERTMNFGWDLTRDPRGVDTPVHEIGHTLGFPHEHQNPFAGIEWDEAAVYEYFGGPPNNWARETTFYNILRKLSQGEVGGSEWDPDSVMHYSFPSGLILEPEKYQQGIRPAGGLSPQDIEQTKLFYPPLEATYPELQVFRSAMLSLAPAEQKNFTIRPDATRSYTIQTFGAADTVMVLFEDQNGDLKYVTGDDDSGTDTNARLRVRLYKDRQYVLRIRLYFNYSAGQTAVMMW